VQQRLDVEEVPRLSEDRVLCGAVCAIGERYLLRMRVDRRRSREEFLAISELEESNGPASAVLEAPSVR
jgi:hypothetical protein